MKYFFVGRISESELKKKVCGLAGIHRELLQVVALDENKVLYFVEGEQLGGWENGRGYIFNNTVLNWLVDENTQLE